MRAWPLASVIDVSVRPNPPHSIALLVVEIVGDAKKPEILSPNVMAIPGRGYEPMLAALRQAVVEGQSLAASRGVEIHGGELSALTHGWTVTAVTRTYEGSEAGRRMLAAETQVLGLHGYVPASQSQDGGHIHAGRILMTGGLSVLAGSAGTRSKGSIIVSFHRPPAVAGPIDIPDQIRKLADLRDAGVLTSAEFDAKKRELLRRM